MLEKNWTVKKYIWMYTLTFLLFMGGAFLVLILNRRTLIGTIDGLPQYYLYMRYMGREMRTFLSNLLQGNRTWKLYDLTIGLGSEASVVFRPHLLDLLSVFVPEAWTGVLYNAITILTLYLSGLSFTWFCFHWRRNFNGMLLGSMVYVFCGFTLQLGVKHPSFLLPLIYFPMMLLGVEWIMARKSPFLLLLSAFIGWTNGYYFIYVATVGMSLYVLLRLPTYLKKEGIGGYIRLILTAMVSYLLGMCLAAVFYVPGVIAMTMSARSSGKVLTGSLWKYPLARYYQAFLYMTAPGLSLSQKTYLNYPVVIWPALVCLFVGAGRGKECAKGQAVGWREEQNVDQQGEQSKDLPEDHINQVRFLRVAFLCCIVMLLVPFASYVLAALSYLNGRWIFFLSLVLGAVCVWKSEDMMQMTGRRAVALGILVLLFAGAVFGASRLERAAGFLAWGPSKYLLVALAELAASSVILILLPHFPKLQRRTGLILLAGAFLSVSINGFMTYSNRFIGSGGEFKKVGASTADIESSIYTYLAKVMQDQDDGTIFRADTDADLTDTGQENYPMILGYNGTSLYNSFLNGSISDFFLEQESVGINAVHRLWGIAGRSVDEALMNVRYFLGKTGDTASVPYGYHKLDEYSDETWSVYENNDPLPFGYTYHAFITRVDFDRLSGVEKEQVLLYAMVAEDGQEEMLKEAGFTQVSLEEAQAQTINSYAEIMETADASGTEEQVTTGLAETQRVDEISDAEQNRLYRMDIPLPENGEGAEKTDTGYRTSRSNATISFTYQQKAGYECYLRLKGLTVTARNWHLHVIAAGAQTIVPLRGKNQTYALERENFSVRLGYFEENGEDTITLQFLKKGNYRLEGLELYYVPMVSWHERIQDLGKTSLKDAVFADNKITGTVHADETGMMVFSLAPSSGWKAYVDGEERQLHAVNTAFMGLLLEPGEHEVILQYTSPGLVQARWMSVAALLLTAVWGVLYRRRMRAY